MQQLPAEGRSSSPKDGEPTSFAKSLRTIFREERQDISRYEVFGSSREAVKSNSFYFDDVSPRVAAFVTAQRGHSEPASPNSAVPQGE